MAISFSRPDPSSPTAVADANFPTARRGFDQQEVREFLRVVAAEMARMQDRERFLEHELRAMRQQRNAMPSELDDESASRLLGDETARIVQAARESSTAIRVKAEEAAERMMREARQDSQALREDAELDAARRRKDAEVDSEAELAMAKQQGREMVDEARAYRERALSELARRRDLARQQIDQLVHGRDRLVQAFERARLVAADVVAELVPLGELDEYVNLSPTTGPVPVMVPASRLADASAISDDALALRARSQPGDDDPALDPQPASPGKEAAAGPSTDATRSIDRLLADDLAPAASDAAAPDDAATRDSAAVAVAAASPLAGATVLQFPGPANRLDDAVAAEIVVGHAPAGDAPAGDTPAGDAPAGDGPAGDPAVDDVVIDDTPDSDSTDSIDHDAPVDEIDAVDEIDDEDVTATDVDHLFARLRNGSVTSPDHGAAESVADDAATKDGATGPTPFDRREEALTPLIVASARTLKRVLADEQNAVLDRLRRPEAVRNLDDILVDADDHGRRFFDAISGDLLAAAEAGADSLGGATLDAGDTGVLAPVRASLLANLVSPLRDRLDARLRAGDGDNEAITKSARAVYREWKTKHIDDHLDDLLRLAYSGGAFEALDVGEPCAWIVDPSVGPCSDCEDNSLQGAVPAGSAYPTGHITAPAHAGCRCLLARSRR